MKGFLVGFSVVSVWLSLILIMGPFQLATGILSRFWAPARDWNYSIWILQDVAVNVIHGGSHKVTVSSKIGWMAIAGYSAMLWMERVVNWIWLTVLNEENHCRNAIEPEDNHRYDKRVTILGLVIYWGIWFGFLAAF